MSFQNIDYIALYVESLRQAENFYVSLFGLEILLQETPATDDGNTLSDVTGDTMSQGCLLGCGGFRLALCRGVDEFASRGRLGHICLRADAAEIHRLQGQVGELGCVLHQNAPDHLIFEDPYGVRWEVKAIALEEETRE